MKPVSAAFVLLACFALPAQAEAAQNLCHSYEQTLVSCTTINHKILSLCAARNFSALEGYLQYRYGDAGKVEFEFPAKRGQSKKQFTYTHNSRAQVDESHIRFEHEEHSYDLFSAYSGEDKTPVKKLGVLVDDKTEILCQPQGAVENWSKAEGVLPCDAQDGISCAAQ